MPIHVLHTPATRQQIAEMLDALGLYIKLAVDVRRGILARGGLLHADCEAALLEDGSLQEDIWGADWIPATHQVRYEALINVRPRQGNLSMAVQDPRIRVRIEEIVRSLLEETGGSGE